MISVIIPTHNYGHYIQQTIESVFNQTYNNYELIVIDDGSTDNTREILDKYISGQQIEYVYRNNQGQSVVLKYGVQLARGELIIFITPRDLLFVTLFEDLVACLAHHTSKGMVVSGYFRLNCSGKILAAVEPWNQFPQINFATWLCQKQVNLSTIMFRREWLEKEDAFTGDCFPLNLLLPLAKRGCEAVWSYRIGLSCHKQNIDILQEGKVLETFSNQFFNQVDLPPEVACWGSEVRYQNLIWLSWLNYQQGHWQTMTNYLYNSLKYTSLLPTEIIADWLDKLSNYATLDGEKLNVYTLNQIPEWQTLIKYVLMPKKPQIVNLIQAYNKSNLVQAGQKLLEKNIDEQNFWATGEKITAENSQALQNYLAEQLPRKNPKVSIITSVFAGDKYIEEFLNNITEQTIFYQCELILINPNSPGNEEPIIREYLEQYPNIIYQKLESDPGLYAVWNLAIKMARGEYITNANLDDRHSPQHLEKHLEFLEQNPDYDVVSAPILVTKKSNETWHKNTAYTVWYTEFRQGGNEYLGVQEFFQSEYENAIKTGRVKSYNFTHCLPVWRKKIHEKNGYFDEESYGTSADWEFWLRCAVNGSKFQLLKAPLGLYLEDQLSHNRTYKNKQEFEQKIIEKYLGYALKNNEQPARKVDLSGALKGNYGKHRSGWDFALESLKPLHNEIGIWLDGFIEKKFVWGKDPGDRQNNPQPYQKPWIGFLHVPPNVPRWFQSEQSPLTIFATKMWQESMESCLGLFCLSASNKSWLEEHLTVPISNLLHPTEIPEIKFSLDNFLGNPNRKIVQVGWWLRKLNSIYYLPTKKMKKAVLRTGEPHIEEMFMAERKIMNLTPDESSVENIAFLPNDQYDKFLANNIVFVELYDTSANNIIIECLVRNTPILVNPLPAVKEYLGEDYPFYFQSLEEAGKKADDLSLIEETYHYLKSHPLKEKLTGEYFLQSFVDSEIYQKL
ncbi:MAG: glycosyltransferase family 2 protein [Gomphosphaeria aponina SAG 52.96 = DSM 107014]|uniref:Glycosyltransferase family 2 protein n=1 Tax=Gomphosphaeria aponina SAG 52.96 = DSM 107014 TaxID=1521640 RepID=A0A941GVR6_9CHRO|nr:glycosyltransferase family 2 protein [Gomphosphaeria aponina SAG 52.96 = DSM 107014]